MRFLKKSRLSLSRSLVFGFALMALVMTSFAPPATAQINNQKEATTAQQPFTARHGDGNFSSYSGAYYSVAPSSTDVEKKFAKGKEEDEGIKPFIEYNTGIRPPTDLYDVTEGKRMNGRLNSKMGKTASLDVRHLSTNMVITWRNYFRWFAYIVSGVGMFALVLLAFVGKFQWKWFFSLAGSVFVLGCFLFLSGQTGKHGDGDLNYVNNEYTATDGWLNPDTVSAFVGAEVKDSTAHEDPIRLWRFLLARTRYTSHAIERFTYISAGIGVFAMAMFAFFGKFEWKWFFMICGGLFLMSGFQMMIDFLHGSTGGERDAGWYSNLFVIGNEKARYVSEEGYFFTYVVAGLGVMFLAIKAFFGKFEWKHFASICGALLVIGGFQTLINFTALRSNIGEAIAPTTKDESPEMRRNLEAASGGGSMMPVTEIKIDNIYTVQEPTGSEAYTIRGSGTADDDAPDVDETGGGSGRGAD
ncbi:MAG: hypothetical protein ACTSXQ_07055 [Alphaproteobacteria bacterium]